MAYAVRTLKDLASAGFDVSTIHIGTVRIDVRAYRPPDTGPSNNTAEPSDDDPKRGFGLGFPRRPDAR